MRLYLSCVDGTICACYGYLTMLLHALDVSVILVYLALILGIGFRVETASSARHRVRTFLGSRLLPWWTIAMSGRSSYFDITGTMWIVTLIAMIGMKAMWMQWIWWFIIPVFYAAFMGERIRRSHVTTGSEWMVTRFGSGKAGEAACLRIRSTPC